MVNLLRNAVRGGGGDAFDVETIGLGDLKPDPQNAREHTSRNVAMVVDALQEVGAARSIVIDEKGVVLAGNATIKAAGQAGLARVKVVDADGSEIIAVRRTGLTSGRRSGSPYMITERQNSQSRTAISLRSAQRRRGDTRGSLARRRAANASGFKR